MKLMILASYWKTRMPPEESLKIFQEIESGKAMFSPPI